MAVEADEVYSNLNKLLDDICEFLSDEGNYEKLSPYARKQADELISRSKTQLQEIAKIIIDKNECDEAYVDMERKSMNESDPQTTLIVVQPQPNPYANLPAKDLSQDIKYGSLSWKCRIILKFEKIRRMYAGIHNNWLLVYSSEKDSKPIQTLHLKYHKAQEVVCKPSKNPPQDFELIPTQPEGKSYYFLAMTHKDMLQWVSHINRCHESLTKAEDIFLFDDNISETYDMIPEINNQEKLEEKPVEDDEDDIYHDIETYAPEIINNTVNKPPDLPARRCFKTNMPLPPLPQRESDNYSSDSSTYDPVIQSRTSVVSKSSFSEEEDEDDIYEIFLAKPDPEPQFNGIQTIKEKFSNSTLEKPKTFSKPKILEKPKHIFIKK